MHALTTISTRHFFFPDICIDGNRFSNRSMLFVLYPHSYPMTSLHNSILCKLWKSIYRAVFTSDIVNCWNHETLLRLQSSSSSSFKLVVFKFLSSYSYIKSLQCAEKEHKQLKFFVTRLSHVHCFHVQRIKFVWKCKSFSSRYRTNI